MSRRGEAFGAVLLRALARPVILAFWALVGWGSLLLLATAGAVLREGLRPALLRLAPAPHASVWAWLNALSAALALVVWLLAAGLVLWAHRSAAVATREG